MMGYTHYVQKWNGKNFEKRLSDCTTFYSIGAYLDGDDDVDSVETETLGELYKLWQDMKDSDKTVGEKGWKYRFYHHQIVEEVNSTTGKAQYVDYTTEGKVYRRGSKVYFKAVSI